MACTHLASVTNAVEKLFDRIPEFINPVVYNNDKTCQFYIIGNGTNVS